LGVVAATLAVILAELLTNRPALGPLGFLVLIVPPALLVDELGGRRLPRAERLFVTIVGGVILALLTGIAAALSPRGLDTAAVAVVELGALAAALLLWLPGRGARHRTDVQVDGYRVARTAPESPTLRVSRTLRMSRSAVVSLVLVVAGLGLAGGGFAVAAWAAQAQVYAGFVQLWSLPPAAGGNQTVGVRNQEGGPVTCDVTLIRPGQPFLVGHVGTLAAGQEWTTTLPAAAAGQTGPWQLSLSCTDVSGAKIGRQLTINPPA
jgi:hypothetical protein